MKRLLFSLAGLVLAPGTASAQDGWGWSILVPSVTQTDILGTHLRGRHGEPEARAERAPPRVATTPSRRASDSVRPTPVTRNLSVLRYTPSKTRRNSNLAGFVAMSRRVDPAGAKSLEDLFAQGDFIEKVDQALAPHGLHVNNVGDAYAVWWMSAWQATRGIADSPSPAATRAVQAQASHALAATPELASASDAQKQQLAEALLIQAAMLDAAVMQSKGNTPQQRALGVAAAQGALGMGLDLATMELTETGFVSANRK